MDRLSDTAIEIINGLHTERLDYNSEYLPLIDAANSLAAYEDTGLTPEEIRIVQECLLPIQFSRFHEIMEAEREERLFVLPCKVGTPVYCLNRDLDFIADSAWLGVYCAGEAVGRFGETMFLSREEAEAARKGGAE